MNLISINDLTEDDIYEIFKIADKLKEEKEEIELKKDSILVLYFEKPSTRTRLSFESAIIKLGGHSVYLQKDTTHIVRGESLEDTVRVISLYADFLAARVFNHNDLLRMADVATIPIINALSDLEHPTQALTDLYTIREIKHKLEDLKIAFIGDIATNTANSLMVGAAKLGAEVSLIGPKGYNPNSLYLNKAREFNRVDVYDDIKEGLMDADVVYTDTFVSMGQESEREERLKRFMPYQLNQDALSYAKDDVIVMHCLPAHRGEEIAADVIDGPHSVVWQQAKNKELIARAILLFLSARE
ncbi:MAG: ornithine carbamoyltransferase, anabolic [Candidatus Micrarchaeota archaeon]|nr:MAG: ornithine carbamoyltransferase, anabolic [Candidatus Micrarchaeota archaeon]